MYHFCAYQKDTGRIKDPQQKNYKCSERAVNGTELYNSPNIVCKEMLCDLKEYCCEQGSIKGVGNPDLALWEENIKSCNGKKYHKERN
jgi:hypothetical protein